MRKKLVLLSILFSVIFCSYAQEVQFPPSVLASGGGVSDIKSAHISKWRIGRVNVLYIGSEDLKSTTVITQTGDLSKNSWEVQAYPNPVTHYLNLQFELENPTVIGVELTDISGRKVLVRKQQLIYPNEKVQLDLLQFTPALYLVHILSEDKTLNEVFKITKQ